MCFSFLSQFILSRPMIIWYWMSCERVWDTGGRLWLKGNVVCVHLFQHLHLAHQQFRQLVAQFTLLRGEGGRRACLYAYGGQANRFGGHDLVGACVFEDAVLVDAASVGEGIGT